uniref:ANK_REP_REGION domain-containing protein n=1 Tax=Macrostomum lignano TaxID=282301 RepID=A0A1I8JR71_9PLAT
AAAQAVTAWCEVVRLLLVYGADLSNKSDPGPPSEKAACLMECSASSQEFLALARLLLTSVPVEHPAAPAGLGGGLTLASHQLAASEPRGLALRLRLACGDPLVARARRLPLPRTLIHYVFAIRHLSAPAHLGLSTVRCCSLNSGSLLAANARQSQFGSLLRNRLRNQSRSPLGGNAIRRCHSSAPPSASPVWHPDGGASYRWPETRRRHLAGHLRRDDRWSRCAGRGLTRLTRSGLSMTNWSLFKPSIIAHQSLSMESRSCAAVTQADWEREFQRYQSLPGVRVHRARAGSMSLNDFKAIFWLEFLHRTWGRAIGAAFLLPAAYFWARGPAFKSAAVHMPSLPPRPHLSPPCAKRVLIYGSLILAEGLLGWYMVPQRAEQGHPDSGRAPGQPVTDWPLTTGARPCWLSSRCSHYRRQYGGDAGRPSPTCCRSTSFGAAVALRGRLAAAAHLLTSAAFATAISGAFVCR